MVTSVSAQATSSALAEKYLRETQVPEILQAQISSYADQYAKGHDAAYRKLVHEYLERIMGWDVLKEQYLDLVRSTYTEQEINAFLQFSNTPPGRSMNAKNIIFASKLSAIAAQRGQDVVVEQQVENASDTQDRQSTEADELNIMQVEKFQVGDQIYFTGEIKNNGKHPARGVSIEVNLFQGTRFVDQYSTYIRGEIPVGASRLFKISCGCKDAPPAEHDAFKLHIVSGY